MSNYNNVNYLQNVVLHDDKHWIIKPCDNIWDSKREYLTYLLGKDIVNITEIKRLSPEELLVIDSLLKKGFVNKVGSFATRIAQDYQIRDLPLQGLDAAVAGELVFSTWIRRRDAHEFNRAYVLDIPVFFDHGVAFQGQKEANEFFEKKDRMQNKGFAGSWRVIEVKNRDELSNRFRKENWGDTHFIYNKGRFIEEARKIAENIKLSEKQIPNKVMAADIDGQQAENTINFLVENIKTLDSDVEKMLETVFSD